MMVSSDPQYAAELAAAAPPALSYVLVTPARNEAAFIGKTLESMVRQTVLPLKWVIVDDGSTDNTAEVVKPYLTKYSWIELVEMPNGVIAVLPRRWGPSMPGTKE